ncbi:hypothetical protein CYMTET_33929 [Cymbomonas tetramitiformis]|uniref:Uncharacterized protein n=1 Tax=Cymbomonas tetramitiformis TaxID=36881 RepID=A0AAE0KQP8_9CHLO|nr:hypothetical protein CYMTET_33929 [Cymbomonas tetramitiformis]
MASLQQNATKYPSAWKTLMAAVGVQNATVKVEALQLPFTLPTDAASTAAAVVLHADQNKMDGEFMSALRDCAFFTGDSFTVLESEMILIKTQTEELLQATDYAEGICGHDQPAAEETRNPSPHSALAEGGDDMIVHSRAHSEPVEIEHMLAVRQRTLKGQKRRRYSPRWAFYRRIPRWRTPWSRLRLLSCMTPMPPSSLPLLPTDTRSGTPMR